MKKILCTTYEIDRLLCLIVTPHKATKQVSLSTSFMAFPEEDGEQGFESVTLRFAPVHLPALRDLVAELEAIENGIETIPEEEHGKD